MHYNLLFIFDALPHKCRIWGPQVLLVYLGLQRYDHVPTVRAARLVLVSEAYELFLRDWRYYRHVCEVGTTTACVAIITGIMYMC